VANVCSLSRKVDTYFVIRVLVESRPDVYASGNTGVISDVDKGM
jgi:hypothetical protein